MARLIDADSLKYQVECSPLLKGMTREVLFEIDHAPTVEERKHGRIEYNERLGTFECSVCKACWYLITPPKHKYCPECGAKMDGKDESDGKI